MCTNCGQETGIDQQITYLERVIADQERLKVNAENPSLHEEALQKAREALENLLQERARDEA